MKPLKIAFLTLDDPSDKRSWSGTNYFLLQTLIKNFSEIEFHGPYQPQPLTFICSGLNFLTLRLLKKRFDYRHSKIMRKKFGKHFNAVISKKKYDVVVVSGSTSIAAGITTTIPIIYINDRTIEGAMNYHKVLTQLFDFSRRQSIETDRLAIEKSALTIFSSAWASETAIQNNPTSASKIKLIPFGANLEELPKQPIEKSFPIFPLKLLFAGVNWEDKGGPIAFETLQELLAIGIDAELIVCGCIPPITHPKMKVEGFLNKNIPAEFEKLIHHFKEADFFILPTKYEAYGLVFCESAAYGLPALAPATGGITTIIEDGVTGFLLPTTAHGKDYASKIIGLVNEPEKYPHMRKAAYNRFISKLNWDAWANEFCIILEEAGLIKQ